MADMGFKPLAGVEQIAEIKDDTTVLVVEDGAVKQVAKDAVGGAGSRYVFNVPAITNIYNEYYVIPDENVLQAMGMTEAKAYLLNFAQQIDDFEAALINGSGAYITMPATMLNGDEDDPPMCLPPIAWTRVEEPNGYSETRLECVFFASSSGPLPLYFNSAYIRNIADQT